MLFISHNRFFANVHHLTAGVLRFGRCISYIFMHGGDLNIEHNRRLVTLAVKMTKLTFVVDVGAELHILQLK